MADVTINQLNTGTPNKSSAIIPYSDGSTTYKTSPSGIVAASPGALLQVVQAVFGPGFQHSTTSSTYENTGIEATITPQFTTSRIMISVTTQVAVRNSDGSFGGSYGAYNLTRNNTELLVWGTVQFLGWSPGSLQYIDSPNSISPLTYRIQSKIVGSTGRIYAGWGVSGVSGTSNMILSEIAG